MFDWTADDCVVGRISQVREPALVLLSGPGGLLSDLVVMKAVRAISHRECGRVDGYSAKLQMQSASLGFPIPESGTVTVLPNEGVVGL